MLGAFGATAIDFSAASVTVTPVMSSTPSSAALMLAVPSAMPVALPFSPLALLMLAVAEADELQVTVSVTFLELLSE